MNSFLDSLLLVMAGLLSHKRQNRPTSPMR
jgi:hypothetical protein